MAKIVKWHILKEISGKIKSLEFRTRKNKLIEISARRIPQQPRTSKQIAQRRAYGMCYEQWYKLSDAEKQQYNKRAEKLQISGYNLFMKECLKTRIFEIVIDNTYNNNDLQDYQVLLNFAESTELMNAIAWNDRGFEILDSDKETQLSFFIAEINKSANRYLVYVKIPTIPAQSYHSIYVRVKKSITEKLSNGKDTFDFFDDFETFDSSKYSVHSDAEITVSDSILYLRSTWDVCGFRTIEAFSEPSRFVAFLSIDDIKDTLYQAGFSTNYYTSDVQVESDRVITYTTSYDQIDLFTQNIETEDFTFTKITSPAPSGFFLVEVAQDSKYAHAKIYEDKAVRDNTADVQDSYSRHLCFSLYYDDILKIDYIAVAKFTRPEPTQYLIREITK